MGFSPGQGLSDVANGGLAHGHGHWDGRHGF
jgi:hypothetical protein